MRPGKLRLIRGVPWGISPACVLRILLYKICILQIVYHEGDKGKKYYRF